MAATKPKPRTPATPRPLLEWAAAAPAGDGPALVIDRGGRVIERVRVLGRYSKNSHDVAGAENGTEYTPACMRGALPLYEGCEVLANHDTLGGKTDGLKQRRTHRGVEYVVGVLRNSRVEADAVWADLHYFDSHPVSARLLEDVERRLGVLGLSHDATSDPREDRVDPAARRLVVNRLTAVNSVDVVRRPATNRNLWEDQEHPPVTTTLRRLLEARTLSAARARWRRRLTEDDAMAPGLDAPIDAPADACGDEDDALWSGFKAAIDKLFDKYKSGDMDEKEVGKQVVEYLKAHDKLTAADEPDAPPADETPDPVKTEAVKDVAKLSHQIKVRDLFEELRVTPDRVLREAAEALPDLAAARRLIERDKARGGRPASASGHGTGRPAAKATGKGFLDAITG